MTRTMANEKIEALRRRAAQLFQEQNWDELIPVCDKLIDLKQEADWKALAYFYRGVAYFNKGEYGHAITDFSEVIKLDQKNAAAYYSRGLAYTNKGEDEQAIIDFNKAIELDRHNATAYYKRGGIYFNKGEYDHAIADFDKAIELDPNYAAVYLNRGLAYFSKGVYDQAITDLDEAIKLDPENAAAYFYRGIAYNKRGIAYTNNKDYDHAIKCYDHVITDFNKAIDLDPKFMATYSNRDSDYNNRGIAYTNRGLAYFSKGVYDQAIADFSEAIKLDPENAAAYFYRGIAYTKKSEYDHAITNFNKAIELNPQNALAYLNRGLAYFKKSEYDQARNDCSEALVLEPKLRLRIPMIYITSKIDAVFGIDKEKEAGNEAFKLYGKLLYAIRDIQQELFCNPQDTNGIVHYTSLHALKSLAQKKTFRLYNANYMNDPEEGRAFFEIMKKCDAENIEDTFYDIHENQPQRTPAYIGSFVTVPTSSEEQKDSLFLWRTYGRHDEQEAAGSCLIFKQKCFADSYQPQIGAMEQQSVALTLSEDKSGGKLLLAQRIIQQIIDQRPALYNVLYAEDKPKPSKELEALACCLKGIEIFINKQYIIEDKQKLASKLMELEECLKKTQEFIAEVDNDNDKIDNEKTEQDITEDKQKLASKLMELEECLKDTLEFIDKKNNEKTDMLKGLVRELLDSIRFLFKAPHYSEEREVRVISIRYHTEPDDAKDREAMATEPDDVEIDVDSIPPRFYLAVQNSLQLKEVILGPEARHSAEWERWITEKLPDVEVKQSKIKYRGRH